MSELSPSQLPAVPTDPFDGQPLRYRKVGEGYLLYSVGADLKDDAGNPVTVGKGDIAFRVIKPPRKTG